MYSLDDFNEIIKDDVCKVNYQWFLNKQEHFKRQSGDSEYLTLKKAEGYPIYEYDEDGLSYISEYKNEEEIISIDLKKYVECYLPIDESTRWGEAPMEIVIPGNKPAPSENLDEFASNLVLNISRFPDDNTDNTDIHKFIYKVLHTVEENLAGFKEKGENAVYTDILNRFLQLCTAKLYDKFERRLTMDILTSEINDHLKFNLEQQELAALLFIIQRAGFLNYSDTSFLRFCAEHFSYNDNGKSAKPTSLKNFTSAFSKVASSQVKDPKQGKHSGLATIVRRLNKVLKLLQL